MIKKIAILNINHYKEKHQKLSSENSLDSIVLGDSYYKPLLERLMFLERDKLFKIIEKFLSREIDMRDFLCAYEDFYSEILKLREKFCSELDELKDLQLLNIGTLELKINSNSSYFYSLVNLLDQKYGKLENAEFIFIGNGKFISEPEEQEFYELIKELFKWIKQEEEETS